MTRESLDLDALEKPRLTERVKPSDDAPFLPFSPLPDSHVPGFLPIGGPDIVRQTSSTHGANGYISTDPDEIGGMIQRMKRKVEADVDQFSFAEFLGEPEADTMILAYGVTARAAKAVYKELKAEGKPVSLLILKTLWPIPENLIRQKAQGTKRVLVVEMNMGQYVREVERVLKDRTVEFLGQMDGRLIRPSQIKEVI